MTTRDAPLPISAAPRAGVQPRRTVFVRDLELKAHVGVYDEEIGVAQPVIINLIVDVVEPSSPAADRLEDVLCYDKLTQGIKAIIAEGHIKLVETLAERIAALALAHPFARAVQVTVEKTDALKEAAGAGVEIMRTKSHYL